MLFVFDSGAAIFIGIGIIYESKPRNHEDPNGCYPHGILALLI